MFGCSDGPRKRRFLALFFMVGFAAKYCFKCLHSCTQRYSIYMHCLMHGVEVSCERVSAGKEWG